MQPFTTKSKILVAVGAVVVALVLFAAFSNQKTFGALTPTQTVRYSLVSSSTLSNAYTGAGSVSTTARLAKSLSNVAIGGVYVPRTTGSKMLILIERSIDDGVTYQPYQTITPESADILINTSGSSSSIGSPFIVPGNGVSTSGTSIGFSADFTLAADYLRFSAKEVSSSSGSVLVTPGTVTLKTLFTSL